MMSPFLCWTCWCYTFKTEWSREKLRQQTLQPLGNMIDRLLNRQPVGWWNKKYHQETVLLSFSSNLHSRKKAWQKSSVFLVQNEFAQRWRLPPDPPVGWVGSWHIAPRPCAPCPARHTWSQLAIVVLLGANIKKTERKGRKTKNCMDFQVRVLAMPSPKHGSITLSKRFRAWFTNLFFISISMYFSQRLTFWYTCPSEKISANKFKHCGFWQPENSKKASPVCALNMQSTLKDGAVCLNSALKDSTKSSGWAISSSPRCDKM